MSSIILKASAFATGAHAAVKHVRKYTGRPYIEHPKAEMGGRLSMWRKSQAGEVRARPQSRINERAMKSCSTCRFWDGAPEDWKPPHYGQCKINPPIAMLGTTHREKPGFFVGVWPGTGNGDWCGRWEDGRWEDKSS